MTVRAAERLPVDFHLNRNESSHTSSLTYEGIIIVIIVLLCVRLNGVHVCFLSAG